MMRVKRGSIAISTMKTPKRNNGMYEGAQPKLMALKAWNRIVLTINTAGTRTIAIAVIERASPGIAYGQAYTVAAITPAADGLGMPTK